MVSTPYQYISSTGVIVPDTDQILADVQAEYKASFGADLVVTADTPQGVLIVAEALARTEVVNNNAAVANQINPNIGGGVFLDAIMAFLGQQRTPASPSVVMNASVTGVAGTTIPAGSQAKTGAGDLFQTITNVILSGGGTGTVTFQSLQNGPIPCAASALTHIVTNVLGWETVTNPTAATLGTTTQSDQAARVLRQNTLAFQAVALPEAITSALYNVVGVQSLTFQENITDSTQTINGISMISHSVYACVNGGLDKDVAAALLENKSSGCGWNGGTSVAVIEPASGQSYTVKFDRPTPVPILIKVTTPNGNADTIIQAILDYAAGIVETTDQNGTVAVLPGFVVGASISPFEIAGAIMAENPGIYVKKVELSLTSPVAYATNPIAIGVNQIAATQASYITVVIA